MAKKIYPIEKEILGEKLLVHPETDILELEWAFGDCEEQYLEQLINFSQEYPFIGSGRSRAVFRMDSNWVIKTPLSPAGECDNQIEATIKREYPTAKAYFKLVNGFEVLIMEFIQELSLIRPSSYPNSSWMTESKFKDSKGNILDIPDWAYGIDCMQVGLNKQDELVAYDFA